MSTVIKKIGHASISEKNTTNGAAGDSTGYEVCTRDNYSINNLNPNLVLRPKTQALANLSALACEAGCANNNIGYSQFGTVNRNTLYQEALKTSFDLAAVSKLCNTDCSAFMTVCAIAGGAKIEYGSNAPTTSNMRTRFKQSGYYDVLTDANHITKADYLKRGDILVCEGRHTIMVLENGEESTDDPGDIEIPSSTTPLTVVRVKAIEILLSNITATSAKVNFRLLERSLGVDKAISNTAKWKFNLTLKALFTGKVEERLVTANGASLADLTPNTTYLIQISALKTNGEVAFCSAPAIFTTKQKEISKTTSQIIEFGNKNEGAPLKPINKVYIRTQNKFKPVIIYKSKQEV